MRRGRTVRAALNGRARPGNCGGGGVYETLVVRRGNGSDHGARLVLSASGAVSGGTLSQLTRVGYRIDGLCFRDPAAASVQASKTACRAAWAAQGCTVVVNLGSYASDLDGPGSGRTYLLPSYGFLD